MLWGLSTADSARSARLAIHSIRRLGAVSHTETDYFLFFKVVRIVLGLSSLQGHLLLQ
jgi:hypothetical protein